MHNSGTSPLILPTKGPVLASIAQPQMGFKIEANKHGVAVTPFTGDQSLSMQLNVEQATALGVNLISAAALAGHAIAQAGTAPTGPRIHTGA
jgi:hypothetical protein